MSRKLTSNCVIVSALVVAVRTPSFAGASETINYANNPKGQLEKFVHSDSVNNDTIANYSFDKVDNRSDASASGAP